MLSLVSTLTLLSLPFVAVCQSNSDGYTGYRLDIREDGDPTAVLFETDNTTPNVSALVPEPDVLLNASVHVGEIDIVVDNLTAKINIDAQVLQLLDFNAGVGLSIDKVELLIQNVTAKVFLEARLANLVTMVSDVLGSIDLNPVIAELGNGLGTIVNDTAGLVGSVTGGGGSNSTNSKRDVDLHQWDLYNNILYSINNFAGNTNKRHVLSQNGDIIEQILDDQGTIASATVVGNYQKDMSFNGYNKSVTLNGQDVWEEEWVYAPFMGLYSITGIFKSKSTGVVVGTKLLAEARGGGSADIGNEQG